MLWIVDQSPAGKPKRLPATLGNGTSDFRFPKAQKLHFQVITLSQLVRRQTNHRRSQPRMRIHSRADVVDGFFGTDLLLRGQQCTGFEELFDRAHDSFFSSSMYRLL